MKFSTLFIRLPISESQPFYWRLYGGSQADPVQLLEAGHVDSTEELKALGSQSPGARIIVLVPGELVTLRTLEIGLKLNKTIEKSLPYRLENELSDDVEELHFSVLSHNKQQATVAVVSKDWMNRWFEWLQMAELNCQQMLPDYLALPYTQGVCSLCQIKSQWLIRYGEFSGSVCDDSWVRTYLDSLEQADQLKVIDYSPAGQNSHPLSLLEPDCIPEHVSLLQGTYHSSARQDQKPLNSFRPIALAASLLASFAGYQYSLISQTESEAKAIQLQTKELYNQLYPGERLIRPVFQLKQKLINLKSSQHQSETFLVTLNNVAPIISSTNQIKIQSSHYSHAQSKLTLTVTADSISSLTDLRDALSNIHQTQLRSLESNDNKAKGILVIN
ncbi:type II secretion system protein GspL [Endozoicomonas sp. OPT23]|uniref:type II secretion system protein GspL n=1 Tax=Endozoicomonas sp. OPT23 TaxID=2072845 RepID=UPI00129A4E48|nr:type II secretion system protein GspL [Endozoicomonas sp. OPT23]MRI34397.1 type II secretion system protein GspL [Endozoicomonas sp. OPT23]